MYRRFGLLILITLFLSTPSFAAPAYIVRLTNGSVLEVNTYTVKDGKVYLQYPVGEAAIPLNNVVTIMENDGGADILQSKGKSIPHTELKTPGSDNHGSSGGTVTSKTDNLKPKAPLAGFPDKINNTNMLKQIEEKKAAIQKTVSRSKPVNASLGDNSSYDPVADALVEKLATADKKQAEEIGNQLNAIFDATNEGKVEKAVSP